MAKKVTVNVTAENIAQGKNFVPSSCPINLALRPLFPGFAKAYGISVYATDVCFRVIDEQHNITARYHVDLPPVVAGFVRLFDNQGSEAVSPFSFELELPEGLQP